MAGRPIRDSHLTNGRRPVDRYKAVTSRFGRSTSGRLPVDRRHN